MKLNHLVLNTTKYFSKWWCAFQCSKQRGKNTDSLSPKEIFREIDYLVISFVKTLLSRNFCQEEVREKLKKGLTPSTYIFRFHVKSEWKVKTSYRHHFVNRISLDKEIRFKWFLPDLKIPAFSTFCSWTLHLDSFF